MARVLLILVIVGYAVTFSYLTLVRYAAFEARALDLGNLNQAIWNTAHGNWFHLTNQPGTVNRLSLHVEPILIPIALLYRLYPAPPLLLVLQAVVVALGAIPLFALARYKLVNEWVALVFAIVYLLNPTIQAANWLEFHPVTLAPTFLLAAFYYLIRDRPGRFALFAILAASCKEEIALLVFMMGAYALLIRHRPRWGVITMGLALAWALLAVLGIQQLFADGNIHWNRYAYLGDSPGQMVLSLLTRPDLIWAQLAAADAGIYLWALLWPTAFLALLAPEVLLLALPSLAINLLADFSPMHQVHTLIYAAPIVPFVLASAVMGLARLLGWAGLHKRAVSGDGQIFAATRTAGLSPRRGLSDALPEERDPDSSRTGGVTNCFPNAWVRTARQVLTPLLTALVLVLGLTDQRLHGYLPGNGNYLYLTVTDHHQRAAVIIDQIPVDAAVSAQDRLNPHVSGRETIYIFPRVRDARTGDADTIFVDVTGPAWPQHPNDLRASVDELLAQGFDIAAADDGYLLLRQLEEQGEEQEEEQEEEQGVNSALPDSFYTAWRAPEADVAEPLGLQYGGALELLDFHMTTDRYGELVAEMTWLPLREIERDLRFYVAYLAPDGSVLHDSEFYQPVNVLWYPTTLWEPGIPVRVRTLPWTLETDQFVPLLGLYAGENWAEGEPLPISPTSSVFPLLQGGTVARLGGYQRDDAGEWQPLSGIEPTPAIPLDVDFGGMIRLIGADLPTEAQAGEELRFTLHWRASAPVDFDYTAFAHLLDAQGNKVAQLDWQPHDLMGILPTGAWPQGWPVTDTQMLPLSSHLAPGDYTLLVGLYNWQSGERLAAQGQAVIGGDAVGVGPLQIE